MNFDDALGSIRREDRQAFLDKLDLEEVWAFGLPESGMQLPGLDLNVLADGKIDNLPVGIQVLQK